MLSQIPPEVAKLAHRQARKSNIVYRLGSVIWDRSGVLGTGYNYTRVVATNGRNRSSTHAEKDAMSGLRHEDLIGTSIFTCRISQGVDENWLNAMPCPRCMRFLKQQGISKIYFTNELGEVDLLRTKDISLQSYNNKKIRVYVSTH